MVEGRDVDRIRLLLQRPRSQGALAPSPSSGSHPASLHGGADGDEDLATLSSPGAIAAVRRAHATVHVLSRLLLAATADEIAEVRTAHRAPPAVAHVAQTILTDRWAGGAPRAWRRGFCPMYTGYSHRRRPSWTPSRPRLARVG